VNSAQVNYNSPGITWNGHCYEQCPCELREAAGEKQLPAACAKRRFDAKNYGTNQTINCCLHVTKRLVYAVCFKS